MDGPSIEGPRRAALRDILFSLYLISSFLPFAFCLLPFAFCLLPFEFLMSRLGEWEKIPRLQAETSV
jgi:hypothetical protein